MQSFAETLKFLLAVFVRLDSDGPHVLQNKYIPYSCQFELLLACPSFSEQKKGSPNNGHSLLKSIGSTPNSFTCLAFCVIWNCFVSI